LDDGGKPVAGYSGKTLSQKLGLKEGDRALLVGAPGGYERSLGCAVSRGKGELDFIQCFCRREGELKKAFPSLKKSLAKTGMLWISWPKKAALSKEEAREPDVLDENKVRALGLAAGLVDVKVCAVDEIWSGLKFMYRLSDR
jgi:hypothetical protein